jgi:2',3'-cyclic-nucleotide 2'-phosphodiesterase (5'-nucleotidase family)
MNFYICTNVKNIQGNYNTKIRTIMILKFKHFVIFITILLFISCKQERLRLSEIIGKQITIEDSIAEDLKIKEFVEPYRKHIDAVLDSTLAFAANNISKTDNPYNTTAGNLMADAVLQLVNPVFKSRTQNNIDFVLLNHGGIRSSISKGNVSARTAYEIMPFENSVVVVNLSGKAVREMIAYLIKNKIPHPISGIQIILNKDDSLKAVNIQGKPFDEEKTYFVATSNYLLTGGDNMNFFLDNIAATDTDYLIRNIMIDYFTKMDTIEPKIDDRFIKLVY